MNNPIETDSFRHYLRFISLGRTDLYQISEPEGFTKAQFEKNQQAKKYARDESICAIDKVTFPNTKAEYTGMLQQINPQGDSSEYLDYGFEWLQSINNEFGFESKVEYIITKDDLQFSIGVLDFTEKDLTDGYTYFSCKIIQNNNVADYKRHLDTKFNAFSDKNVRNETITPITTFNLLHKALPIAQESIWKYGASTPETFILSAGSSFNFSNAITKSEIRGTLSYIQGASEPNDFKYIKAIDELYDVKIEFTNILVEVLSLFTSGDVRLAVKVGTNAVVGETAYVLDTKAAGQQFNNSYTLNIPNIKRGDYVFIYFRTEGGVVNVRYTSMDVKISLTAVSIDIVQKASRYIDLIKQGSKFVNDLPVVAPRFDVGGEFYEQAVFNRRMVSQRTDYFYTSNKTLWEDLQEVNCDNEIDEEKIFIGLDEDFYTNDEIGVFNVIPENNVIQDYNQKLMINAFNYGYKTYEQDRSASNTDEAFHTDSSWTPDNRMVENKKDIKIDLVRDSFSIQNIVSLEIQEPTTATDDDDKVYIKDILPIAPTSFGSFGNRLLLRIQDGILEILNKDSSNDDNTISFVWTLLGMAVGGSFQILEGANVGNYTILEFNTTSIRLQPIGFTPTLQGNQYIRIKWFYNNVAYTTRTDEGFVLVQSLSSTKKYYNMRYTIKRNILNYWSRYLASVLLYRKTFMSNSYFKSNGTFKSQLSGGNVIIENAIVNYADLKTPLISGKTYKLSLTAEFYQILDYFNAYKQNRGFIRCYDYDGKIIKLYVQDLKQTFATNELTITAEERFETEYLYLNYSDGILTVNDTPYNLSGVSNWWIFNNDYFKAYDENNIPICNDYKYSFVFLNGVKYNTKAELVNALTIL